MDHPTPTRCDVAAWILMGFTLLGVLWLHLLPALLAGLLVYEIVHATSPLMHRRLPGDRARVVAVTALASVVIGVVATGVIWLVVFLRGEGNLLGLLQRMADILNQARASLPPELADSLPSNATDLQDALVHWLENHARDVQTAGARAGLTFAHVLIGMVVGAMVSLLDVRPHHFDKPLSSALTQRLSRFGNAFQRIVFAQVRISAVNTLLTGLFLAVGMPLLGVHLPFTKTLVAVTFVVGLLPVVGNLISNTVIVIVGLSVSPGVAVGCLVFLVVIHKLEYFLNARIVGSQISAHAWELLCAMLVMEAAFGLPGIVAAPIYYAYVKDELVSHGLV